MRGHWAAGLPNVASVQAIGQTESNPEQDQQEDCALDAPNRRHDFSRVPRDAVHG